MNTIARPTQDEVGDYFIRYVNQVPEGDVLGLLAGQYDQLLDLLGSLDDEAASRSYAEGKWTIKQLLGHMTDSERVFAYRALAFARQPGLELPGFEQDEWVEATHFDDRSIAAMLAEQAAVRQASLTLFAGFTPEELGRAGRASGADISVRGIIYVVAGHELHHLRILRERYLTG